MLRLPRSGCDTAGPRSRFPIAKMSASPSWLSGYEISEPHQRIPLIPVRPINRIIMTFSNSSGALVIL
ncbi:hypothetical protein BURKHO8Y_20017 [Burkholderia sp. 8Y]|nr:hypothetical protein BURKHO8Y_20017 [Burkholderia sp. 8Y]